MSSSYFNMSFAAVSETSPNATYGDQSFDGNALPTEGYQGYIVYYPTPSYYHVYNVVTPVEMNGATFYYYSAYAVPFYSVSFDDMASASNIADMQLESADYAVASLIEEQDSVSSVLFDDVSSASSITPAMHLASPDYALANLFEDQESLNSVLFDDVSSASSIASHMHLESPDYALANLFEDQESVNSVLCSGDLVSKEPVVDVDLVSKEPVVDVIPLNGEEEMLDSTNASFGCEDVYQEIDKCHGDYDKEFGNGAVVKLLSDSMNENTPQKESSEGSKDNWEFLQDLSFDNVEDQEFKIEASYSIPSENELLGLSLQDLSFDNVEDDEFKIEASYSSPSENELLGQPSLQDLSFDNVEDDEFKIEASYSSPSENELLGQPSLQDLSFDNVEDDEFKIEASYCGPSENELLGQPSYNDLEEDAFNSPFPSGKVFKKLRYFKKEIEVLPTIYEVDEPPEDEEELPEAIEEVESSKNPKKKRFKTLRRWFSQLTSCCRKNKKPPD